MKTDYDLSQAEVFRGKLERACGNVVPCFSSLRRDVSLNCGGHNRSCIVSYPSAWEPFWFNTGEDRSIRITPEPPCDGVIQGKVRQVLRDFQKEPQS